MFGLGIQELLVILLIILIFFGAEKIPQLAKSLGKGMSEFKKAQQDLNDELNKDEEKPVPVAVTSEPHTASDVETAALSQMICPHCNKQTVEGSLYCSQCGHKMTGETRCTLCQRQLSFDEKFCPNCGRPRNNEQ